MTSNKLLVIFTIIGYVAGEYEGNVLDNLRKAAGGGTGADVNKGNVDSVQLGKGFGAKLVGKSITTTTTTTTERPKDKDEPVLPGGGGNDDAFPACFDLMVVIDVSCSVKEEDRIKSRDFAAEVVSQLLASTSSDTRVGLVRYSQTLEQVFELDDYDEAAVIVDEIRSMNTSDLGCKTHTHLVLEELYKTYFTSKLGDRPNSNYPNVAVLFTDGRTISQRFADETKRQAKNAEVSGIELHVVDVPHRRGLGDLAGEFDALPTRPELLYNLTDEGDITNIVNDLSKRYGCGLPGFGGGGDDPDLGCANVVFAIDVSCSIERNNVTKAIEIAKDVIDASGSGHRFGAFTYDNNTVSHTPSFAGTSAQLDNLVTEHKACKTRTNRAITYAETNYFQNANTSVLIVFGDGNESPWNENNLAIRKAEAFKDKEGTIIWVTLTSNRDEETRTRGIEQQINVIASLNNVGASLIFQHNDPDVATIIANTLNNEFPKCLETEQ